MEALHIFHVDIVLTVTFILVVDTERRTLSVASNDSGHGSGNELDGGRSPIRRRPFDKERFVSQKKLLIFISVFAA